MSEAVRAHAWVVGSVPSRGIHPRAMSNPNHHHIGAEAATSDLGGVQEALDVLG